jgi:hypothetical protein
MILLAEAERAKDIAAAFDAFRRYDGNEEIVTAIELLGHLRHNLRELDRGITARRGVVNNTELFDDLELLQHSVAYTLQDVWLLLGMMLPEQAISHDYRAAWKEIQRHCSSSSSRGLCQRLDMYILFCRALIRQLNRYDLLLCFHRLSHRPLPPRRLSKTHIDITKLTLCPVNHRNILLQTYEKISWYYGRHSLGTGVSSLPPMPSTTSPRSPFDHKHNLPRYPRLLSPKQRTITVW